jgi:hypothetical protein
MYGCIYTQAFLFVAILAFSDTAQFWNNNRNIFNLHDPTIRQYEAIFVSSTQHIIHCGLCRHSGGEAIMYARGCLCVWTSMDGFFSGTWETRMVASSFCSIRLDRVASTCAHMISAVSYCFCSCCLVAWCPNLVVLYSHTTLL